ncbi:PgaD family protein [Planococcus sp. 107-1]|uniref:PgaD family protein n=1 Tax=Planococcus sp. 107-1 TaxID=2908840 RepID=UPI001F39801B|nr:PgaD family protein [Planococcus sp. 107-1]UJF26151.1 PgaD family protein [Planococcus sp. 107-1]
MAQSGPRLEEENFIITGNRSWFHVIVDTLFTLIFWAYSLLVVVFFLSATFGFNTILTQIVNAAFNTVNQDIRDLVLLGLAVFLIFYALLFINRLYNKKKFGVLKRRHYPDAVTNIELASLGLMDEDAIEKLQNSDYAVFETNPITPLERKKW